MATGRVLLYLQLLHQLTLAQADDLQPAMDRIMASGKVGSPMTSDFKKVSRSVRSADRLELWRRIQLASLHMAVNVADHVRALALLLSQPSVGVPVYAHSTAARVAIESATNVAYLLDRAESFDLRFARGVAFLISDSDQARRTAVKVPGNAYMPAPGPAATRDHEELMALIKRAKIEIIPNVKGRPKGVRVTPDTDEAPIDVKTTDLVHAQYPDMPAVYSLMSGVTHGMPHKLGDNAWFANRHAHWDTDPLDVGGSVLAAANAAHTMLAAHAWHYGLEDDPAIAATHARIARVDAAIQRFARDHVQLPRPILTGGTIV
ncbi:MAG TPA: hypothetical protein DGG94_05175 [Micromonosporaceae bacterium]|nr:hypothetical protein [Micromonosporaceae bacterium]